MTPPHDEHRRKILARRSRFVAIALAGASTTIEACFGPCLKMPAPDAETGAASDAGPSADAGVHDASSLPD